MKKILFSLVFIFIFSTGAFSKTWQNNIGIGFSVPFSSIGVNKSGEDSINQLCYGAEGTYIGIHQNGFSIKADVSLGIATSKDISLQDRKINVGAFENVVFGAGYSFVHTEKTVLGACAAFGVEMSQYSVKEDDVKIDSEYYDVTKTISLVTFSAGADFFAVYRLSPRFGFFANLAARFIIVGNENYEYKQETTSKKSKNSSSSDNDIDLLGNFIVQPSIGLIWTF